MYARVSSAWTSGSPRASRSAPATCQTLLNFLLQPTWSSGNPRTSRHPVSFGRGAMGVSRPSDICAGGLAVRDGCVLVKHLCCASRVHHRHHSRQPLPQPLNDLNVGRYGVGTTLGGLRFGKERCDHIGSGCVREMRGESVNGKG